MRRVSDASSGSLLRSTIDAASSLRIYSIVTGSAAVMTSPRPQKATRPLPPVHARQPSSLRNSARLSANSQSMNSRPYGNNSKGSRYYAQRRQACVCRRSGHPFRTGPQGGGQGFRPAQEGRSHSITCPLQVAAGRVRSDL